jgi:hypothetical protein
MTIAEKKETAVTMDVHPGTVPSTKIPLAVSSAERTKEMMEIVAPTRLAILNNSIE